MTTFVTIITAFPTVIFTVLLGVSILFWLVSLLGFLDLDSFLPDALEGEFGDGGIDMEGSQSLLLGVMHKFRLVGIPITIVLTALALFSWLFSYYAVYFLWPLLPFTWLEWLVGIVLLPVCLFASAWISGKVLRPLRGLFKNQAASNRSLIGQTAVVRSVNVTTEMGEVDFADGGAGLILKVRSEDDTVYERGEKVVLIRFDAELNVYYVIAESEFLKTA